MGDYRIVIEGVGFVEGNVPDFVEVVNSKCPHVTKATLEIHPKLTDEKGEMKSKPEKVGPVYDLTTGQKIREEGGARVDLSETDDAEE